jgi:GxxExxY protein
MESPQEPDLSYRIIGCALEAHHHFGPGLLKSIYEECMCRELTRTGIGFVHQ